MITISAGLAIVGILVFLLVPRHGGRVGAPPKKEIAEGAAFADKPADCGHTGDSLPRTITSGQG